ncbi:O-Antigen ligase [Rubripirellula obstinata]|uniref:O-Antigen ligase n=1 Tax=Rubripirellula obstinata TaxID=406547 RepID=A0A5B1CGJ8_9BACT|nr:O-antigen ligase family protein [Rubripirellula obstinata]KAA1260317.1 O-Antigen ligase [Rubripirellula obstinata]
MPTLATTNSTAGEELQGNRDYSMSGLRAFPILCAGLLALACFFNTVDLNYGYSGGEDHVGLDWQVAIKLVIAAACSSLGLLAILFSAQVRSALVSLPGCILVALAFVFIVTSSVALPEAATVARVAAIVNFGYLCFVPAAISLLGLRRLTIICLIALVTNLVINWIMYLGFPASGVYEEELWSNVIARRMGGLGHPNSVARTGVLSIILALSMLRSRDLAPRLPLGRTLLIAVIVLGCMTMLATFSRTAIVAGAFAVGLLLLDKIFTRIGMFYTVSAITMLIAAVVSLELISGGGFFSDSFLSMTTKTGDMEELTSATGRTAIWAESLRLISLSPITGYGLNSAPFMMKEFSLHPHNVVLHASMSGGILAGLLVLVLLGWNFFFGLTSNEPLVRAISIYVLVSGIFEDTVLDTFASPSTLLWLVVLIYPTLEGLSRYKASRQPQPTNLSHL